MGWYHIWLRLRRISVIFSFKFPLNFVIFNVKFPSSFNVFAVFVNIFDPYAQKS